MRDEIIRRVNAAILLEFDLEESDLREDARLGEDLDMDSLDGVDLVVALEKEFKDHKIKIDEKHASKLRTLGDIYDYIESFS